MKLVTTPDLIALTDCPFCGDMAQLQSYGFGQRAVRCTSCGVETRRYQGNKNAIDAWNKRAA